MNIPENEQTRFGMMLRGQAERFGLTPEEYLRKVWYHEEASRLGEYMAMLLVDQLGQLIPSKPEECQSSSQVAA